MVVDAHVHVHPDADGLGGNYDASPERLVRELASGGPDKVILLPIDALISTEFVYEVSQLMPERIFIFGSLDPKDAAVKRLEYIYEKYRVKGLKLHPRRQGIEPSGKEVSSVVAAASEMGLPVVFDCFPWGHDFQKYNHPAQYDILASKVPEAKIILAHCAGHYVFDAFTVAKSNPNLYLDISLSILYYQGSSVVNDIAFCIRKLGADRVIYGSDYPQYGFLEYLDATVALLDQAGFSGKEKDLIMGGNIERLIEAST